MGEGILRFDAKMKRKRRKIPKSLLTLKEEGFLKAYFSSKEIRKLVTPHNDLLKVLAHDGKSSK